MAQTRLIKQVLSIQLLEEKLMGLYVISDGTHHSDLFDTEEKERLLALTDSEFVIECERILDEQEPQNL